MPAFHINTTFHIVTDLSSAVFGEVMLKLASSWLQHHPLHIHYPSTIPTLAYSPTIKTPARYMLSLPASSLACIKDMVKARYFSFFRTDIKRGICLRKLGKKILLGRKGFVLIRHERARLVVFLGVWGWWQAF